MFLKSVVAIALAGAIASSAGAATIVNLEGRTDADGLSNATFSGTTGDSIFLTGGRYVVSFTQGDFTAHNRYNGGTNGCNAMTGACTGNNARGWETVARFFVGANPGVPNHLQVGDFDYWNTSAKAFAESTAFNLEFIVPTGGSNVYFYIPDNQINDNIGGVSLRVAAVPEMGTWAMLIAGFGLIGAAARRRRVAAA